MVRGHMGEESAGWTGGWTVDQGLEAFITGPWKGGYFQRLQFSDTPPTTRPTISSPLPPAQSPSQGHTYLCTYNAGQIYRRDHNILCSAASILQEEHFPQRISLWILNK